MANADKLFADGFLGYASALEATSIGVWSLQTFDVYNPGTQLIGAYGRNGRNGIRFNLINHSGIGFLNSISKTMPTVNDTCIGSVAFRYSAPSFSIVPILHVLDGDNSQVCLTINLDGTVSAYRGNFGTGIAPVLLGTSVFVIAAGSFVNINWRIKVHPSAGTVDVWFNGADSADISLTSQNTRFTSFSGWTAFALGMRWWSNLFSSTPPTLWDYSDFVVKDGSLALAGGIGATDKIGDVEVDVLLGVTGNGNYAEWVPLTGVNHGDMVRDTTPDYDVTYNEGGPDAGKRDTYFTNPLPSPGGIIIAVIAEDVMKKSTIGTSNITPFVRSAGVNTDGDSAYNLSDSYIRYRTAYIDFGGVPITPTLVNAMELGVKTA